MWRLTKIYISLLINPALQVIEEWNIKAYKKTYIFIWVNNNYYGGMLSNTYALDSFQRNVVLGRGEVACDRLHFSANKISPYLLSCT